MPETAVYCECETPVMDVEHDAGCRRCGRPVDFSPKPVNFSELGAVLPNGATVIAASARNANEWVLLCLAAWSPHPYATWKCRRPGDGSDTHSGHYFHSIADAARDFETRP